MPRIIEWSFETPWAGMDMEGEMEFPGDATDEEIEETIRDDFFNQFNYSWSPKE